MDFKIKVEHEKVGLGTTSNCLFKFKHGYYF